MEVQQYEKKILRTVKDKFGWSDEELEIWYSKPNRFLDCKNSWKQEDCSPKELVQSGEGEQVLTFIKFCLDAG